MSAVVPDAVVDRIFAFMAMEKTGRIELNFKRGRLLVCNVTESIQVGDGRAAPDSDGLDSGGSVPQDTPR